MSDCAEALFELPVAGHFQASADGRLLRVNSALCQALGREHGQLLALRLGELTCEEDHSQLQALLEQATDATAQPLRTELRLLCGSGEARWFTLALAPVAAASTTQATLVGTVLDVDHRTAASEASERNQAFLSDELHAMESLHQLTVELQQIDDFDVALHHVLRAVAAWNRTRCASVHLYCEHMRMLELAAESGMPAEFRARMGSLPPNGATPHAECLRVGSERLVDVHAPDIEAVFSGYALLASACGHGVVHALPLLARDGRPLGVLATYWPQANPGTGSAPRLMDLYARQIAHLLERRQAQESLAASETAFRAMFESTAVGMAQVDSASGRFLHVNETLVEMTGYPRADLLRMDLLDLTHPENIGTTREGFVALVRGDIQRYQAEKRIVRRNGTVTWVQATMNMVLNAAGAPLYTAAIIQDISERTQMEQALRGSEMRFRAVADSVPVLIWVVDLAGELEFANRAYVDFFGLGDAQLRGFDARTRVHDEDHDAYFGSFVEAAGAGVSWEGQVRAKRADGAWRRIHSRARPLHDDSGALVGYVGSSHDLTDLLEAQAALIEADRRKDQFLATLAHELRNPLAPVSASLASLSHRLASGPERKLLDRMERQVSHMVRLVDDLMEVSRITRGTVELRKGPVDLVEVLASAVDTSRPLIDGAGHRLRYIPCPEECWVHGDPVRLAQVFSNLLNNAAKYSPHGGSITLALARSGDTIKVTVSDRGVGVPPERLEDIFGLFTQLGGGDRANHGGLGIGLTLVRSLVQLHDGRVSASSEGQGKGSLFTVQLPAIAPLQQQDAPAPAMQALLDSGAPARRILVVDDNRDAADAIAEFLGAGMLGHVVRVAYDGASALQLAGAFNPQLVLLDLGMPDMDGYETCKRLRALRQGTRLAIVALSGWGQADDLARTAAGGFDRHLVKPVNLKVLAELLNDPVLMQDREVSA